MTPRRELVVPERLAGARLDAALAELCPDLTKARLQKLCRRGDVRIDGRRLTRSNGVARGGERIRIDGLAPALDVLFEDAHLVIVDKPAGVLTHATERAEDDTLSDRVAAHFGPLPDALGVERPGVVHRLDRETSGAICLARTEEALFGMQAAFRDRLVEKRYLALCAGEPGGPGDEFEVDLPLGPVPGQKDRQRTFEPGTRGKEARTSFRVVERRGAFALLECRPLTGRRHQIRVHLAARGVQLLGDRAYRVRDAAKPAPRIPRHALHAWRLAFEHPILGGRIAVEAPLPADLSAVWQALERA